MKFKGSFGDWLKERRKALDLTQRDLADQVGCAEVTIRRIEGDASRPSRQIAERLADVLAIVPDEQAAFVSFARRLAGSLRTICHPNRRRLLAEKMNWRISPNSCATRIA